MQTTYPNKNNFLICLICKDEATKIATIDMMTIAMCCLKNANGGKPSLSAMAGVDAMLIKIPIRMMAKMSTKETLSIDVSHLRNNI